MPIQSIKSDVATLTLTAIGQYPVPVERLWNALSDPRKLERFWGPPTWPATFTEHRLETGGRSQYFMTGPHGEISHGYWVVQEVEPGKRFLVRDGFANEDGTPNTAFPESTLEVTLTSTDEGCTFAAVSTFGSVETMEQLLKMGMLEGLTLALGQIDAVLADLRELSAGFQSELIRVGETVAVVERVVRGPMALVWRAHNEKELIERWMLGPEGWTMPVCQVATRVGESYRYEWENAADGQRFGFEGELLESQAPHRAVTTERMIGMEGPGTKNELTLSPLPGNHTRVTVRIEYPTAELREIVLGTGMVDGMEISYARLEKVIS